MNETLTVHQESAVKHLSNDDELAVDETLQHSVKVAHNNSTATYDASIKSFGENNQEKLLSPCCG